jgi:predicted Zn-dependent protease
MIFGDNPEQGVVRGSTFLHPTLRLAIDFPNDWDVNNGQSQVVAKEPGVNAFMVLQPTTGQGRATLESAALASMQRAGFRAVEGGATTINGLYAFVGTYQGTMQDLGRVGVRAAHIVHNGATYLVAGIAPQSLYYRVEPTFVQAIRSFRPMTRGEAEGVHANRIDLYTARAGDTWVSLAERQGRGLVKPATLAIMNSHAVNDQPRPGERLKIVVGG